jgi:hypothetical protein
VNQIFLSLKVMKMYKWLKNEMHIL